MGLYPASGGVWWLPPTLLIGGIATRNGLNLSSRLDKKTYETGQEISDKESEKAKIRAQQY